MGDFEVDTRLRETTASVIGERLGLHSVALVAAAQLELGEELEAAATIERWQSRSQRGSGTTVDAGDVAAWAAERELGLVTWVVGADLSVAVHVAPDGRASGRRSSIARCSDGHRPLPES